MFRARAIAALLVLVPGFGCAVAREDRVAASPSPGVSASPPESWIVRAFGPRTLIQVKVGKKWGYVDRNGQSRIAPQFDGANPFIEGLAVVCIGRCETVEEKEAVQGKAFQGSIHRWEGKFGIIDTSGKYVANPQFDGLSNFSEGLAAACIGAGCKGFTLLSEQKLEERWGFIDRQARVVIPYQFEEVGDFGEGLAKVCIENCKTAPRWGLIDATGKVVIAPQFDYVDTFWDGLAEVKIGKSPNERTGYIDRTGRYVVNPQ